MNNPSQKNNFFLIGIGASAGGVQAIETFFSSLPDSPGAAFVVVQHLSPHSTSAMREIIQRRTQLIVHDIEHEMLIQPNRAYVLVPGKSVTIKNGHFCLHKRANTCRDPINKFFKSAAKEWGKNTVGIVLSGTGNDGTEGLKAIGNAGGIALVQSPETAQFSSMPSSAIPSGCVDEILSPSELAQIVFDFICFLGRNRL